MSGFTPINCECLGWAWYPELGEWSFEEHHPTCPKNPKFQDNVSPVLVEAVLQQTDYEDSE